MQSLAALGGRGRGDAFQVGIGSHPARLDLQVAVVQFRRDGRQHRLQGLGALHGGMVVAGARDLHQVDEATMDVQQGVLQVREQLDEFPKPGLLESDVVAQDRSIPGDGLDQPLREDQKRMR